MKSIGLCMIVRNEAAVIRRCLESVLPLIDYVLIVDTGSTDATRTVVRDFLSERNIPGEVVDEPWQNFAYNRTFALRKLREKRSTDSKGCSSPSSESGGIGRLNRYGASAESSDRMYF